MIYKKYLLLGVSLCMLNACNESKSVSLEGSLDGIQADSIYLYQVDNEHYGSVKLIKSIAVTDGRFAYPTDSIRRSLLFLFAEYGAWGVFTAIRLICFWNPNPCSLP
mgnify:CR=1 FL=1